MTYGVAECFWKQTKTLAQDLGAQLDESDVGTGVCFLRSARQQDFRVELTPDGDGDRVTIAIPDLPVVFEGRLNPYDADDAIRLLWIIEGLLKDGLRIVDTTTTDGSAIGTAVLVVTPYSLDVAKPLNDAPAHWITGTVRPVSEASEGNSASRDEDV